MSHRRYLALNYIAEPGGIPQQQLSEILCMDANNTVLLLNELEDAGLVRRDRDPADRRRHIVQLTERGEREFDAARRNRESLEDEVLAALDPQEREALHQLLAKALDR
jgi:DNA-binding MarR family transcriptional regulator